MLLAYLSLVMVLAPLATQNPPANQAKAEERPAPKKPELILPGQWKGHKVIFLPTFEEEKHYGYLSWSYQEGPDLHVGIPYDDLALRTGVVESTISGGGNLKATVVMSDSGKRVYSDGFDISLGSICFTEILDAARDQLIGRQIWYRGNKIGVVTNGEQTTERADVARFTQYKITNVVPSWFSESPVRLLVEYTGAKHGYIDVHYGDTNIPEKLIAHSDFFTDCFLTNPRKDHPWGDKVWDEIAASKVSIGMTNEQVEFAWGKPKDIHKTITATTVDEQWVYGDQQYIYFRNGVVTAIQN
jgi:hypothetical protein